MPPPTDTPFLPHQQHQHQPQHQPPALDDDGPAQARARSLRRLQTMPTASSMRMRTGSGSGHLSSAALMQPPGQPPLDEPGPVYPFPPPIAATAALRDAVLQPLQRLAAHAASLSLWQWLTMVLPCCTWLRTYRLRDDLWADVASGVTVAFMAIPQGMSYAAIAGVPSVYGLYGCLLPCLVYGLFGSSRQLAVGPVAVTSLLISSSLRELVPGSEGITNPNNPPAELVGVQAAYNRRAIQLSFMVACFYTAVGVLRLGWITNFLSHSVISGFTSGAAIIIGLSQLKYLLGVSVPRADRLHDAIRAYIDALPGFVWQEWVMGVSLLTMLLTIKYFGKRGFKWLRPVGPIAACVVAIVAVVAGRLQDRGIKVVGSIPAGLPPVTASWWLPLHDAGRLAPLAAVVMLVDLLESTSIARMLAAKAGYELSANQEIVGLGLANFAGSAFSAYSTTGSFSRSAVNFDSGARTGLSGLITGGVVGLVLLCMTPVFEQLPLNVMGAIVISGVSGLLEYEEAVRLFKVRKVDWLVWMTSFVSTMFLGVETGLAISIGLALLIVVYESAYPHTALLGRVGRTTIYRNTKQFPQAQVIPGIVACRVDAPIYFANEQFVHERLRKYVQRGRAYSAAGGAALQWLLLDMSPVSHIDSTGARLLEKLHGELQGQGIQLCLCNPAAAVVDLLERTGFPDELGRENIFVRMHDAVSTCLVSMIADGQAVRSLAAHELLLPHERGLVQAGGAGRGMQARRSAPGGGGGSGSSEPLRRPLLGTLSIKRSGALPGWQAASNGSRSPLLPHSHHSAASTPTALDAGHHHQQHHHHHQQQQQSSIMMSTSPRIGLATAAGALLQGSSSTSSSPATRGFRSEPGGASPANSSLADMLRRRRDAAASAGGMLSAALQQQQQQQPAPRPAWAAAASPFTSHTAGLNFSPPLSEGSQGLAQQLQADAATATGSPLQLLVPASVLQHPALLRRSGGGASLLHRTMSLQRSVTPRTLGLLHDVFSASNEGDGIGLASTLQGDVQGQQQDEELKQQQQQQDHMAFVVELAPSLDGGVQLLR